MGVNFRDLEINYLINALISDSGPDSGSPASDKPRTRPVCSKRQTLTAFKHDSMPLAVIRTHFTFLAAMALSP